MEKVLLVVVHVFHARSLLMGTQVEVFCNLTPALAQANNLNCFKSSRIIWTVGVTQDDLDLPAWWDGDAHIPCGANRGEDSNHSCTQKGRLQPESAQVHWLNGIHLKLPQLS